MSTRREDYIMYGSHVEFEDIDYDEFENEIENSPNKRFDILYDGMSGEFAIVGKELLKFDMYEGLPPTNIIEPKNKNKILGEVQKCFPNVTELNLMAVTLFK